MAANPSHSKRPPALRLVSESEQAPLPALSDFDALFHRFAPYVATIGLRILGRDGEVDDLVQEVFFEAHRGLESLRSPDAVKGWLARICVRKATRRLKRRRLRALFRAEGSCMHVSRIESGYRRKETLSEPAPDAHIAFRALYRPLPT